MAADADVPPTTLTPTPRLPTVDDDSNTNISPTQTPVLAPTRPSLSSATTASRDPPRTSTGSSHNRPALRPRRQSRQERIEEILDAAHQRSLTMRRLSQGAMSTGGIRSSTFDGGPISRTLSGNQLPSLSARWPVVFSLEPDEHTSIIRAADGQLKDYQGTRDTNGGLRSRNPSSVQMRDHGRPPSTFSRHNSHSDDSEDSEDSEEDAETRWKRIIAKFGSLELDNKGSVARDHLALERTFLAWLRTSLAFASIGIAITQLFRLNTSIADDDGSDAYVHLRQLGKPLGATFLGISILTLFIGFHRYFESQHWIVRGKFPAGRGSVAAITAVAFALMITSLIVVVVVDPNSYEK